MDSKKGTVKIELFGGWEEYQTGEGMKYYYNKLTGQTSWEKPVPQPASEPPKEKK